MTEKQQKRFFFPIWTAHCRAVGWREVRGMLLLGEKKLNRFGLQVYDAAVNRAAANHRAPTLSDLRHGCIIVALGRDKDTLKLNTKEIDTVVDLLAQVKNEADIGADLRRSNPEHYDREALVIKINKLNIPFAEIEMVCQRSFAPVYNSPFYEDLPLPNLRALVGILQEMSARQRAKAEAPF
jgi:hypothetical protein